jgi:hypothetical protein
LVELEELVGMEGMAEERVAAAVQVWAWAWALATELAWVLAWEQEGLDCHSRHCFGKRSLRHCRKLDRFPHLDNYHMKMHHPICSSNNSQLMPV